MTTAGTTRTPATDPDAAGRRRSPAVAAALGALGWVMFCLLVVVVFVLRPMSLGGSYAFTVVSGDSMEPTLSHGDLVLVKRQDSYAVGDVVTYTIPSGEGAGRNVIHRLVGHDDDGWLTQGDNRSTLDPWRPDDGDIVGAEVAVFPVMGRWLISTGSVWVLAAGAAALVTVALWPRRREEAPEEEGESDATGPDADAVELGDDAADGVGDVVSDDATGSR